MDVEFLKEAKVNIGIIGCGKQGKSTVINSLFEYEPNDERAAKASAYEGGGTTELQKFKHPKNDSVLLWDLPGQTDSNRDKYKKTIKMTDNDYDMFILVTKDSVANYSVADLLKLTIRKGAPNRPIIYVKTHTDAALKGYKHDERIKRDLNDAEIENFLNTQREEVLKKIDGSKSCEKIFIVDATEKDEFEFPKFVKYTMSNCGVWLIEKKQTLLRRRINKIAKKAAAQKIVPFAMYFSEPAKVTALGEMLLYLKAFELINKENDQNGLTKKEVKELTRLMEQDITSTSFREDPFFTIWKKANNSNHRVGSKHKSSVLDSAIQKACKTFVKTVESGEEVGRALEYAMKAFSEELETEPLELDTLVNILSTLGCVIMDTTAAGASTACSAAVEGAKMACGIAASSAVITVRIRSAASSSFAVEIGLQSKALATADVVYTLIQTAATSSAAVATMASADDMCKAVISHARAAATSKTLLATIALGTLLFSYNPFKAISDYSSVRTQLDNALNCAAELAKAKEKYLAHKEANDIFSPICD